jgi:hypothetical protein
VTCEKSISRNENRETVVYAASYECTLIIEVMSVVAFVLWLVGCDSTSNDIDVPGETIGEWLCDDGEYFRRTYWIAENAFSFKSYSLEGVGHL